MRVENGELRNTWRFKQLFLFSYSSYSVYGDYGVYSNYSDYKLRYTFQCGIAEGNA